MQVRHEPSDGATFLLSLVRRAMAKDGAHLAMVQVPSLAPPLAHTCSLLLRTSAASPLALMQGGFVRAMRDYEAGPFTMVRAAPP